jgi:MEMO1 family protein
MANGTKIRIPVVSGSFYPDNKTELNKLLDIYFQGTVNNIEIDSNQIKALIIPHAGYIYSGLTAAHGFKLLSKSVNNPHFVLIGPSHYEIFNSLKTADYDFWQTPLGNVPHKLATVQPDLISVDNNPFKHEHCLEVELPFLQYIQTNFDFTGFLTGNETNLELASEYFIHNYPKSIFIISSDLSHYLTLDNANKIDRQTIAAINNLKGDYFTNTENAACGNIGIQIILHMAKTLQLKSKLIYYDTSGTYSHDVNQVVGYTAICFYNDL